jgi:methanogenic corrinoid protein MtbC1
MLSPLGMLAQQDTNDTDFFKEIFGVDKLTIVKEFITVADENSTVYWATYEAYESDRKELRAERIALITEYAENYTNLSEEKTEELCKRSIKYNKKNAKNISKYFKKLKKAGGIKAAAQFLQIENYFLSLSKSVIYENIPFIGELDRIE